MATNTIQRTAASGSTAVFSVPFAYLDKSHVQIRVAGVLKTVNVDYTWPTASTIQLSAGNPVAGTIVERRRVTPVDPITVFQPGNLDTGDLNVSELQPLYVAQEAADDEVDRNSAQWATPSATPGLPGVGGSITKGTDGNFPKFDASGNIVDSGKSAASLTTSETNAAASATAALASQGAAATSATGAAASKTSADADAVATAADRVQTGLDRTQTGADRTQTGLDKTAAAASAAAAANAVSGLVYTYSATTTDADPGNGTLRLNAAPASAGALYIDNLDGNGATVTGLLDLMDDSTTVANKGLLTVRSVANPAISYSYLVTGTVVDGTGYRKVSLSYVNGSGSLPTTANGVIVFFNRTGDKGADGTGSMNGPGSSVTGNLPSFNGAGGNLLQDSGVPAAQVARKDVTNTIPLNTLVDSAAVSLLGRSANSAGARADIAAGADDTLLRRVSSALGFGQLTAGMVPAGLVTYAMLASAAIASNSEFQLGTASKLLSAAALKSTVAYQTLTDAATISWDMSLGNNALVVLAGNRTLGNPTNANPLFGFVIKVTATTSTRTLDKGTNWVIASGVESFPINVATTETVYVVGFVDTSTRIVVTGVVRT